MPEHTLAPTAPTHRPAHRAAHPSGPEQPAPAFAATPAGDGEHGDDEASAAAPTPDGGRSTTAPWLASVALVVGAAGVLVGAAGVRRGRQS